MGDLLYAGVSFQSMAVFFMRQEIAFPNICYSLEYPKLLTIASTLWPALHIGQSLGS